MQEHEVRKQINLLGLAAAAIALFLPAWTAYGQNRPLLAPTSQTDSDKPASGGSSVASASNNAAGKPDATPIGAQNPAASPDSSSYIIGSDDILNIHVWHQNELSGPVTVRPDGKISMPLIGEISASGLTPPQLQTSLTEKLRTFVNEPDVTVIVQQANSKKFNVMGRVQRPGSYSLAVRMRVLDAIAVAGGFSDFAKVTKVYVIRPTGSTGVQKLPFNYKRMTEGHDDGENVELQPGDTVVVP